ncbi:MAG: hypothetical protein IKQ39_00120 [Oscillospiraceae bacterium]|nr:hypothetical protein [Oscillospiraceae bacterium]
MMRYRILTAVSAACLLLSACGKTENSSPDSSEPTTPGTTAAASETTTLPAETTTAALSSSETSGEGTETTKAADSTTPDLSAAPSASDNVPEARIAGALFDTPEEAFANTYEAVNREDGLMLYYAMPKSLRENLLEEQNLTEEEAIPVIRDSLKGTKTTVEYTVRGKKTPEEAFADESNQISELKEELENIERYMDGDQIDCIVLDVHLTLKTGNRTDEQDDLPVVCHCRDGWFDLSGCMLAGMVIGEAGAGKLLDDAGEQTTERGERNP